MFCVLSIADSILVSSENVSRLLLEVATCLRFSYSFVIFVGTAKQKGNGVHPGGPLASFQHSESTRRQQQAKEALKTFIFGKEGSQPDECVRVQLTASKMSVVRRGILLVFVWALYISRARWSTKYTKSLEGPLPKS